MTSPALKQRMDLLAHVFDGLLCAYDADELVDAFAGALQREAKRKVYKLPRQHWNVLAGAVAALRGMAQRADNALAEQFPDSVEAAIRAKGE